MESSAEVMTLEKKKSASGARLHQSGQDLLKNIMSPAASESKAEESKEYQPPSCGSKLPPRVPTLIEESKDRVVEEENVLASSEPRANPQIINAAPTCLDSIAINEK